MLSVGIVGKPNAGKSTLFNALTNQNVPAEDYPFCTIDKNVGVVAVPDERLNKMSAIFKSAPKVPATVTFVDIAGLVKGASKGEGLGNMFLAHIREVDLIMYLLGAYSGNTNPIDDLETVETELILKDIETVDKFLNKLRSECKDPKKHEQTEKVLPITEALAKALNDGKSAFAFMKSIDSKEAIHEINNLFLLTNKKFLIVLNVNDKILQSDLEKLKLKIVENRKKKDLILEPSDILTINAKLEFELSRIDENERADYIKELGIDYVGMPLVISTCYKMLNYITFYTGNEKMVNAWQIQQGTTARDAAGAIHNDLRDGFIRADILKFEDFIAAGGWKQSKDLGKMHTSGKEYLMQDGDMMLVYHQ